MYSHTHTILQKQFYCHHGVCWTRHYLFTASSLALHESICVKLTSTLTHHVECRTGTCWAADMSIRLGANDLTVHTGLFTLLVLCTVSPHDLCNQRSFVSFTLEPKGL